MKSDTKTSDQPTRTQRARRDDIIAATITLINRDGYASASVDMIAKTAKTSKSTVLYHFKSKEAIYRAVVGDLFSDGASYMAPYILTAKNYTERFRAYLTSNLRYIAMHADHISAVHQILKNNPQQPTDDGHAVRWLQQMLEEGQRAEEFGVFNPQVAALIIRSTIDSASFYFIDNPTIDIEHYIQETIHLFETAIGVHEELPM